MNTVFRINHASKRARTSYRWPVHRDNDSGLMALCSNGSPRWRQAWEWGKERRVRDWTDWIGKRRHDRTAREMRPCPYCGEYLDLVFRLVKNGIAVVCYECGARGPAGENEAEAVEVWNDRPNAETETARLHSLLEDALRMLQNISPWNYGDACPFCGSLDFLDNVHNPGCELQSKIDELSKVIQSEKE